MSQTCTSKPSSAGAAPADSRLRRRRRGGIVHPNRGKCCRPHINKKHSIGISLLDDRSTCRDLQHNPTKEQQHEMAPGSGLSATSPHPRRSLLKAALAACDEVADGLKQPSRSLADSRHCIDIGGCRFDLSETN